MMRIAQRGAVQHRHSLAFEYLWPLSLGKRSKLEEMIEKRGPTVEGRRRKEAHHTIVVKPKMVPVDRELPHSII
jgi:hypothetical protein